MKKNIFIILLLVLPYLNSLAQGEGGDPRTNLSSNPYSGCSFNLSTIPIVTNCDVVWFCYDESGNRVIRFAPNCSGSGGIGGGTQSMLAKSVRDTSNVYFSLEATLIYPNPTVGATTLEFDKVIENASILIIDNNGRVVHSSNFTGKSAIFDMSVHSAGIYQVVICKDKEKIVKALVKE